MALSSQIKTFPPSILMLENSGVKPFSYPEVEEEGEDYLNVAEKET